MPIFKTVLRTVVTYLHENFYHFFYAGKKNTLKPVRVRVK